MIIEETDLSIGFHEFLKGLHPVDKPLATPINYSGAEIFITSLEKHFDETFFAIGQVYNDDRFKDGENIHTSRIESIDWVTRELKTMNTLYKIRK